MKKLPLLCMLFIAISACQVHDGSTNAYREVVSSQLNSASLTVGTPVPLPFENLFPNRWNPSNDGTSFEPCVAYSDDELVRFGIDPLMRKDATLVDGQGTRGCNWYMTGRFSLGQVVTNSESLEVYRSGVSEVVWLQELNVDGRRIGLFTVDYGGSELCSTYVQSFGAAVVTNVSSDSRSVAGSIDACDLVEEFTRAYIDKIPD